MLEKTLLAGVQEQRRARRWGIFFKLLTFIYLFGALALFSPALQLGKGKAARESHTAVINVRGMIADEESASADNIVGALRAAFEDANTKGVILRINSPAAVRFSRATSMTRFVACAASIRPSRSMR